MSTRLSDPQLSIPYGVAVAAIAFLAAALGACVEPPAEPPHGWHGPTGDELHSVGLPVTCAPHLEYYPVGGPHNGGWDSNATTFTCDPHPSSSPDNSDFIAGDHFGNDLFAQEGTPAIAVVSGTITHSGYSGIGGNRVTIKDSCGWHYYSAHLETIAPGMTVGTSVSAGTQIGTVGDTGNAEGTQAHIHFSIYPESYSAGIDPFDLLQGVDSSACTGEASIAEGDTPEPGFNPCTDADISSDTSSNDFAVVTGESTTETDATTGEAFAAAGPFTGAETLAVGMWKPYMPHPGAWAVDVKVPDASFETTSMAVYDVAFHGGHAIATVDQAANEGDWVPLFGGQPLKFLQGPKQYVTASNLGTINDGKPVAFDAVRWRYIGPEGGGQAGAACALSVDCAGTLICGPSDTCQARCDDTGCDAGESCDIATSVCVSPTDGDGDLLDDDSATTMDTDGDGIPNYLEGGLDADADGDGVPNQWDHDSDGDGVPDSAEGAGDADGDGILDAYDLDSDGDGIPDADEAGDFPENPLDTDLDGIPDMQDHDSDGDGLPDAMETDVDSDGDGIPDYADTDSDNDGISDAFEAGIFAEEPRDTDGDGTPDYLDLDSDGDGLDDAWELDDDSDGDGTPDFRDLDSDNDGTPDADDPDSDGDGVADATWNEWGGLDVNEPTVQWQYGCACDAGDAGSRGGSLLALALLLLLGAPARRRRG